MKHKNPATGQRGFTVIETTLFLALSSALVLVAILGTGSFISSIRFTDSMRSTHAFLQSQYDEILNGVNPRDAAEICGASSPVEPGKSDCLLLGKLINFDIDTSSIKSYYVVSTEIPDLSDPDTADLSDAELIAEVNPVVVREIGISEFNVPWGATIFASKRLNDGRQVNSYALLRSPQSSALVAYTFNISRGALESSGAGQLKSYVSNDSNIQHPTNFCVRSVDAPDPPAAITLAGGQGQSAIELDFDLNDVAQSCNGSGGGP